MRLYSLLVCLAFSSSAFAQTATPPAAPVKLTDPKAIADAQKYMAGLYELSPELASSSGVTKYDTKIEDISLAGQHKKIKEGENGLKKLAQVRDKESDPAARQELSAYIDSQQAAFQQQDDALGHQVAFIDAPAYIASGLAPLLDPEASNSRHSAGGERLKRYVGIDPDPQGNQRLTEGASMSRSTAPMTGVAQDLFFDNSFVTAIINRTTAQMKKPDMLYTPRAEVIVALEHDNEVINSMLDSLRKIKLSNWETAFAALQRELIYYNNWVKENYLPHTK